MQREQKLRQEELLGGCYSHQVINNEYLAGKVERSKLIPDVF